MSLGDQDNGQAAGQIGQILEKKRLEKGLSLKEVEHATKIRTRYLEGLEREDPTVLPDHVYARGFLKTYANFLGLDGERLSRELKDRRAPRRERQLDYQAPNQELTRASEREHPLMTPGGVERRRVSWGTILTIALAVLVLAGVIGALYYVGSRSSGSGTADNDSEEPAAEQEERDSGPPREEPASGKGAGTEKADDAGNADEKSSAEDAEEKAAASETAPVTVRVFNSPTGMTLLADGAVVYDGVAQPGFSQTFEARRALTVSTRNGAAVEIEVDGQNLGRIGQPGQPVTRDFPVQPTG